MSSESNPIWGVVVGVIGLLIILMFYGLMQESVEISTWMNGVYGVLAGGAICGAGFGYALTRRHIGWTVLFGGFGLVAAIVVALFDFIRA